MAYQFEDRHVISPEHYAQVGHPHEAFAWLRANDPIRRVEVAPFPPFWALTRHADIAQVEADAELFASEPRPILGAEASRPNLKPEVVAEIFARLQDSPALLDMFANSSGGLIRSLVQMDPPDHPKYRALVQPWFTPTNVNRLAERLGGIIGDGLDEMMGDGDTRELDFVHDVAVWPPLKLVAELLGIPAEDEWRILKLTDELFAGEDPEMMRVGDDPLSLFDTIKDFYEYFTALTEERRSNPTDDLASFIANGRIDGEYMPYRELISYYVIVATAGHETTRTAIAGGLHALLEHPEQMQKLTQAEDANLIKLAVEEMIRWTTPVAQFARTASRDTEISGQAIAEGDTVGLFYASANFDEAVFGDPFAFRVDRQPNRHMAFGSGPHQCLGLRLARLEMRIFFEQLLPRIEHMELAGEPQRLRASFVHGLKHLPIRFRLKPRK